MTPFDFIRRGTRALITVLIFAGAGIFLGACSDERPQPFSATDITGATFAGDFRLTDHHGQTRTLADFRGKAVLMFFGYTQCPDICPTTMSRFAEVAKLLGDDAKRLQVLFVTLDPVRDTPALLAQYVPFFHPDFIGLGGSESEVAELAKRFRVPFVRRDDGQGGYLLDHWAGAYAYDAQGRIRLYVAPDISGALLAADLRRLMR